MHFNSLTPLFIVTLLSACSAFAPSAKFANKASSNTVLFEDFRPAGPQAQLGSKLNLHSMPFTT